MLTIFLFVAAALAGSVHAQQFDPSAYAAEDVVERDFAIIGGGAAGTYAAISLADQNKTFTMVEVAERLGGNTRTFRGARAYYMRTVLLDWPDKQALEVLANIREAMAPDSVLLVQDLVYNDRKDPMSPMSALLDFMMMECFSALQRTEAE